MSSTKYELVVTVIPLQDRHGNSLFSNEKLVKLQLRCMSTFGTRLYSPMSPGDRPFRPNAINFFVTPPMDVDDSIKFRSMLEEMRVGGWYTQIAEITVPNLHVKGG